MSPGVTPTADPCPHPGTCGPPPPAAEVILVSVVFFALFALLVMWLLSLKPRAGEQPPDLAVEAAAVTTGTPYGMAVGCGLLTLGTPVVLVVLAMGLTLVRIGPPVFTGLLVGAAVSWMVFSAVTAYHAGRWLTMRKAARYREHPVEAAVDVESDLIVPH